MSFLDNAGVTKLTSYLKTKIEALISNKQDTLVSGTNIKTVNNNSLLGSGNITINSGTALTTQEIEDAVDAAFVVSGYTVAISLTNPRHPTAFVSFTIYDRPTSDYSSGEKIGEITSPTGETSVIVSSSSYGFSISAQGGSVIFEGPIGIEGGITQDTTLSYHVTGDGSLTIDGIDWDD